MLWTIVSAVLTGISFNFKFSSWIIWVSFVPFLYIISRNSFRKNIIHSFVFGIISNFIILFWLARVTALGLTLLIVYLSLYTLFFAIVAKYFLKYRWSIFTLPTLWVIIEFLKEQVWCGFGWGNLGYSQYQQLYLIQIADLLGVKGVSFLIMMVNVFFWQLITQQEKIIRKAVFIVAILTCCIGYSFLRINSIGNFGAPFKVCLVQPNVAQELKWQNLFTQNIIDRLVNFSKKAENNSLVVFPEASWPYPLEKENDSLFQEFVQKINREFVLGAVTRRENKFFNTAFQYDQEGELKNVYHKIKLLPFGEYVPKRDWFKFIPVLNALGDITPGTEYTTFVSQGKKFAVLICFEDIFPLFVRRFAQDKDFFVNITNDGWFKGQPEASQHLSILVFRAIENRMPIARCANTGISAVICYNGKVEKLMQDRNDVFFAGADNFNLFFCKQRSVYFQWGDLFLFALLGIITLFSRRGRLK